MRRVRIQAMGTYLPRRVVTSAELEGRLGLEPGWILRHQGVETRHFADAGETNSYMGARAIERALDAAGMGRADVDLIINASGTAEQALPDTGPLIQRALGWGESGVPAFTVHATCLSFLVGLDVAASLIATGRYRNIVVVSSEITSVGLDWRFPETSTLFGDGAAAAVVSATPEGEASAVLEVRMQTFGDGADLTRIVGGGTKVYPNHPETQPEDNMFFMDGPAVLRAAAGRAGAFLESLRPGLSRGLGDIDVVVPHQASRLGLDGLALLGMPPERQVRTLERFGNCVAASIPLTLHAAWEAGRLTRGTRVLLVGTGAGLSFGGAIVTW